MDGRFGMRIGGEDRVARRCREMGIAGDDGWGKEADEWWAGCCRRIGWRRMCGGPGCMEAHVERGRKIGGGSS
jgi:hypothetical protein